MDRRLLASAFLAAALAALAAAPASAGDGGRRSDEPPCMEECLRDYGTKGHGERFGPEWALPGEESPSKRDLRIGVTLYGWLPQVTGSGQLGPAKVDVDSSFQDALDALKGAYAGRITVEGRRWGAYVDGFYAHLGQESGRGAGKGDIDLRLRILEAAATFRVLGDAGGRRASLHVYGGARYLALKVDADLPAPGVSASRIHAWTDPLVGLGGRLPLARKVDLFASCDAGGFGVGTRMTWNAMAGVDWRMSEGVSLLAGYRLLRIDARDDGGSHRFDGNLRLDGPFAGLTIRF